ncbi:cytosolic protein [Fictibacillus phosphorivorans]|uniref:Cytosolic protein n=1 Tax=Fictibacillus phosphorivorans TaxID=1221500 RepID=A0A163RXK2_9BACL|nr:DUF3055 domain-containing protein [Fictibacillus phosphorivorans]KZE67734.1 cytosolic protein [Fictibacillus phosphorivorans]
MSEETFFLYDDKETTETRFVSFMGRNTRFDLAIVKTTRHYGKSLVLNMLGSHYAIIGQDDLEEEGYLEHAFNLTEEDAMELRDFLADVV